MNLSGQGSGIVQKSAVETFVATEPWNLEREATRTIAEGYRTVVVSDPFSFWPWREIRADSVRRRTEEMLALRELTKGTQDETVF
jgi:hypothetical protein